MAGDWFEEDVEACRAVLGRIAAADLPGVLELCHPDVEMVSLLGQVEGGVYRGHDGITEWYRDVVAAFDDFDPGSPTFAPAGGALLLVSHATGRGQASGVEVDWDWHGLARVRDGRLERLAIYPDERRLREAEGIA